MSLEQLHELGGVLVHKLGWIAIGITTSATSVTLSYYQRAWFTVSDYGVTGIDIAWTMMGAISILSFVKVGFAVYEHFLNIKLVNLQIEREEGKN